MSRIKQRCHHCAGRFGLVRHTRYFKQFCSRACLQAHQEQLRRVVEDAHRPQQAVVSVRLSLR